MSCGSITDTKNLSLTAFAITAAADWKTSRNKHGSSAFCGFSGKDALYSVNSGYNMTHKKHSDTAVLKNLVSLLDELVAVIQPGQEGDESSLPHEDSCVLLQVIHI